MICKVIAFSLMAAPAMAACPVAADLQTGIQFTQADGTVEVFRSRQEGIVEVQSTYPDDYASRTLLGQGVYVLELVDVLDGGYDPDSRMTFAFPIPTPELPVPAANSQWTVKTVARDTDGIFEETITMTWGAQAKITYGTCVYAMIPGEFSYTSKDYDHIEVVHYLPALGVGVLYSYGDDETEVPDTFPVVDIARVAG